MISGHSIGNIGLFTPKLLACLRSISAVTAFVSISAGLSVVAHNDGIIVEVFFTFPI